MRPRRKHIQIERTRHGKAVYYFRVGNGARVHLPNDYGSARFWEAYDLAKDSGVSVYEREPALTSGAMRKASIGKALERCLEGARHRANKRGLGFDLDYDWVISEVERNGFCCAVTGIPFFSEYSGSRRVHPFAPSLDRINPKDGYTKANVRVVTYAVNVMLMDWGDEILRRVVNFYRAHNRTKQQSYSRTPTSNAPAPKK